MVPHSRGGNSGHERTAPEFSDIHGGTLVSGYAVPTEDQKARKNDRDMQDTEGHEIDTRYGAQNPCL